MEEILHDRETYRRPPSPRPPPRQAPPPSPCPFTLVAISDRMSQDEAPGVSLTGKKTEKSFVRVRRERKRERERERERARPPGK
jgi:hypothetical protein